MAASQAQIDRVRAMCAGATSYAEDSDIATVIERHPLPDTFGTSPYSWDESATPPTRSENDNWVPTYDLNAAAADIWEEIAATYVGDFDFQTTDQRFDRSQKHEQAMKQVRYFRSKRAPTSIKQVGESKTDKGSSLGWIGNLPEVDE